MQGQGQKYGQKHETKELVEFRNHLHVLAMVLYPRHNPVLYFLFLELLYLFIILNHLRVLGVLHLM